MIRTRRYLLLLAPIAIGSCGGKGIPIRIHLDGAATGRDVRDLYVIVGSQKEFWPKLAPGESRQFHWSGTGSAELTVQYTIDREAHSWRGPDIDAATTAEVEIRMDETTLPAPGAIRCRRIPRSDNRMRPAS